VSDHPHNYPKLHNATWPGLVGKGPGGEPPIGLDTMLDMTAAAEVDGIRFDGFDIFLYHPHFDIDGGDDETRRLAEKARARNLVVGSVVAPVYDGTGGGPALGSDAQRAAYIKQVEKACRVAQRLRELGVRPDGAVRIDSACSVEAWCQDPKGNQKRIAETFREACKVAEDHGERLAAEGEICWGGMHSWKRMIELLQRVDRPQTLGFQADMSHTLLYLLGYNAPEDALLPANFDWKDRRRFDEAYATLTAALRPWTIDFHVAQNDGTVHGSGSHDKTGRHCLATDRNGKLDIPRHAGYWLREQGQPTKRIRHLCWDGCMFPNAVMTKQQTWNDILRVMIEVRDEHGWQE
jgi:sugar phosphate isomerase/epimerase